MGRCSVVLSQRTLSNEADALPSQVRTVHTWEPQDLSGTVGNYRAEGQTVPRAGRPNAGFPGEKKRLFREAALDTPSKVSTR
jgi:hypothetical protein